LNDAGTTEKNNLPSKDQIRMEQKASSVAGIPNFRKKNLKKTNVVEKTFLPTHDDIKAEKKDRYDKVAHVHSFDKANLKKIDAEEKNTPNS